MSTSTAPPGDRPVPTSREEFSAYVRAYVDNLRSGELGALPIILGLLVIAVIFQSLNSNFLTDRNLVNLVVQMAGITTIAIGVVFVLLLGEIDLSISYTSAVSAVLMTELLNDSWPWWAAMGAGLLAAAVIGLVIGIFVTQLGVPSFVVTLAAFLGLNGVVLLIIGQGGTVIIQDDVILGIANKFLADVWSWIIAFGLVAAWAVTKAMTLARRRRQGLGHQPPLVLGLQLAGLVVDRPRGDLDLQRRPRHARGGPDRRGAADPLHLGRLAHPVRPPRLRRRRQRGGRAPGRHQRHGDQDQGLHDLERPRRHGRASSSPPACARWTPPPAAAACCCCPSPRRSSEAPASSAAVGAWSTRSTAPW